MVFRNVRRIIKTQNAPFTEKGRIWNVNFPDFGVEIKGKKFTPLASRIYNDEYIKDENGNYRLFGVVDESIKFYDCDAEWNKKGFVTITPLKYDKSDYDLLKTIGNKCIL